MIGLQAAAARGGFGEERYEKLDFQKVVRETFMKLRGDSWHIVDAARSDRCMFFSL